MDFLFHAVIFTLNLQRGSAFLNDKDIKTSLDIVKTLGIHGCIFIDDHKYEKLILYFKLFSSASVPVAYLNRHQLAEYIDEYGTTYLRTGLIFKEKNLKTFKKMFERVSNRLIID